MPTTLKTLALGSSRAGGEHDVDDDDHEQGHRFIPARAGNTNIGA